MSAPTPEVPRTNTQPDRHESDNLPEIAETRLMMLRSEMPQAVVQIDAVRADDTAIAVRVTIGLPGGGRHSHIAAADVETDTSWADQLAEVQARAIVHVLEGLKVASRGNDTATPPVRRPAPSQAADEDHLPEYSWNAFWQTMNQRGITRDRVEQALGKTVQEATPKEAVDALRAAGVLS